MFASMLRRCLAPVLLAAVVPSSGCHSGAALVGVDARPEVQAFAGDHCLAESLVLEMLDTEGLYTICGGLKPVSSGFWRHEFDATAPDVRPIERARAALQAALRRAGCDRRYYADVQVFGDDRGDGRRCAEAVIVDRHALADTVDRYAEFFHPLGVTRASHPMDVLILADGLPPAQRSRAYGYLFGYPRYAVDFFVDALASPRRPGSADEHAFLAVPTYRGRDGHFVWAVPHGHQPNEADRAIVARAAEILTRYREQRPRLLRSDNGRHIELLRRMAELDLLPDAAMYEARLLGMGQRT